MCSREEHCEGVSAADWGRGGKLSHGAIVTEASADAVGRPGAGVAPESAPRLRRRSQTSVPSLSSQGLWAPREGGGGSDKAAFG